MSNTSDKVIAMAESEVGYLEKASNKNLDSKLENAGSGNYTKYWRDIQPSLQGQPWCNCFINWIFIKTYGESSAKKMLYSEKGWSFYTPTSASYFKNNNQWYSTPKVGDVVYFKNTLRIHHVGIVYEVTDKHIYTIEGNTSGMSGVVANGGGVFKKSYELNNKNIAGYGRPKYDSTSSVLKGEKMIKGYDTSKYQSGNVDPVDAKNAGYDFVILRIGYNTTKDPFFESDYDKAKASGLKIGVYFYTTVLREEDAEKDAVRVLSWLGKRKLDLPIAYDMEEASMKLASRTDVNARQYNAFARKVKAAGYGSMLYTGRYMFNSYFNRKLITDSLWIADYGSNDGKVHTTPYVVDQVAIHQYTSAAIKDDFYKNKLDRNVLLVSYDELMKGRGTQETTSTTSSSYSKTTFIREVQAAIGATVDGIAGKETLSKTVTVSATKNNKHAVVKALQRYLNYLGYNCGTVDGVAGNKFTIALKNYQSAVVKMKNPDGEATAKGNTWQYLLGLKK